MIIQTYKHTYIKPIHMHACKVSYTQLHPHTYSIVHHETNLDTEELVWISHSKCICSGAANVAVQKVSFGVDQCQCFGLLGINGAGKTTTFKVHLPL